MSDTNFKRLLVLSAVPLLFLLPFVAHSECAKAAGGGGTTTASTTTHTSGGGTGTNQAHGNADGTGGAGSRGSGSGNGSNGSHAAADGSGPDERTNPPAPSQLARWCASGDPLYCGGGLRYVANTAPGVSDEQGATMIGKLPPS
jgi:hypothetical protein